MESQKSAVYLCDYIKLILKDEARINTEGNVEVADSDSTKQNTTSEADKGNKNGI